MQNYVDEVLKTLKEKDSNEKEFIQAVSGV